MSSNMLKLSLVATSLFLFSGCVIHTGSFKGERANVHLDERLSLPASTLNAFDIDVGAGDLSIIGVEGQTDIKVEADIRTNENRDYELTLVKRGSRAELVAHHNAHFGFYNGDSPRIHLVVTMPPQLKLDIEDGSGDLSVRNINASVTLEDGSGTATLSNINGAVTIDDDSGDLFVRNVVGALEIEDGSGELEVESIAGDVSVVDGSGDLSITNTTGKVIIDDGSGDIDVLSTGSLQIIDAGSGDLSIANVRNGVDIES